MSERYKVHENWLPHFITITVVGWVDALSRVAYKEIIIDSLKHCQQRKGLRIYAWVIMSNHLHLIVSTSGDAEISDIVRDLKKFTSRSLIKAISDNPQESRKEWLINMFRYAGGDNNNDETFKFWQPNYHPIALADKAIAMQRLDYLHQNPVRAGIVWEPQHYKYSSASDYCGFTQGLLPIELLS